MSPSSVTSKARHLLTPETGGYLPYLQRRTYPPSGKVQQRQDIIYVRNHNSVTDQINRPSQLHREIPIILFSWARGLYPMRCLPNKQAAQIFKLIEPRHPSKSVSTRGYPPSSGNDCTRPRPRPQPKMLPWHLPSEPQTPHVPRPRPVEVCSMRPDALHRRRDVLLTARRSA